MTMAKLKHLFSFIILLLLSLGGDKQPMADDVIRVGEILDLNSSMREMEESYILMVVSDFYAVNANYRTRPCIYTKDSKDDVAGAACTCMQVINGLLGRMF